MTGDITVLQTTAAVSAGDPDHRQQNPGSPRRPRPAAQPARSRASDDMGFDERDPGDRPRIGLLVNARA